MADTTGAVTDTYTYDAFGNLVARTGITPNDYLYRGEQFDPALGLYYLRARWMNSQTGRLMTRDPYEGDGALSCCKYQQPLSMSPVHHLYEYTHSNPVDYIDPTGLKLIERLQIATYNALNTLVRVGGRVVRNGMEFHHLIQKRFACIMLVTTGEMVSAALDPATHRIFDNAWRRRLPYGSSCDYTLFQLILAAEEIYAEYPTLRDAVYDFIIQARGYEPRM
ncbi:MAG: RHS repeat-associated core domain-containing protein [Bryobacteraceae bacterium]